MAWVVCASCFSSIGPRQGHQLRRALVRVRVRVCVCDRYLQCPRDGQNGVCCFDLPGGLVMPLVPGASEVIDWASPPTSSAFTSTTVGRSLTSRPVPLRHSLQSAGGTDECEEDLIPNKPFPLIKWSVTVVPSET